MEINNGHVYLQLLSLELLVLPGFWSSHFRFCASLHCMNFCFCGCIFVCTVIGCVCWSSDRPVIRTSMWKWKLLWLLRKLRNKMWGSCYSIFSFICMFCWLLFVLLYFFFWPLCCLFFFDIRILIAPLVSFGHCVVCSSSIYGFWLPLWYLQTLLHTTLPEQFQNLTEARSAH